MALDNVEYPLVDTFLDVLYFPSQEVGPKYTLVRYRGINYQQAHLQNTIYSNERLALKHQEHHHASTKGINVSRNSFAP